MRHTRKSLAAIVISAAVGAAGFTAYSHAQSADNRHVVKMATKKEEVKEALDYLTKAHQLLGKADHDEKGHDYKAYRETEQAIKDCRIHLGLDPETGKEK